MTIPERITARWIATLSNDELQAVERTLHGSFDKQDSSERLSKGSAYSLMKAPETLTNAWLRWSMVCNATRDRGLRTSYRR
ncbi:MAG: hypothetical protein IPF98_19975 [Gemmatimonadetes bacterium]|nr:hypothetical protein [Gemmatimonadota bacterium]MCC6770640.1 hypothetical protein [Gemmatimonadaceae bacterium]